MGDLYRSLVDDAFEFTVVLRGDFTVELASRSTTTHTGWQPDELRDRNVAEFVHPEDLDRALLALNGFDEFGAPSGTTCFRVETADGTWASFDVTAAEVTDGHQRLFAVTCRPVDYQHATDEILQRLLSGADRAAAIEPVLDLFSWKLNRSNVGICWPEDTGARRWVSTGVPDELAGAADHGPWALARTTRQPVLDLEGATLGDEVRALARAHNCGSVWVVPIDAAGAAEPALVTVWTRLGGPRPDGHAYGMNLSRTYLELILRWSHQVEQLDRAANLDQLTGVCNRRGLFDALARSQRGGALLYCDLDRFKPVNDAHGHTIGDEVLRVVARRIESRLRPGDVVARTGGDEFVVVAWDLDAHEARQLSERVRATVQEPVHLDGRTLAVGMTIGVVHHPERLDEAALVGADQALVAAKGSRTATATRSR
jgi:diguanylate cyclase (GGDEF)-like protein/PAS domain S-box-containing protein